VFLVYSVSIECVYVCSIMVIEVVVFLSSSLRVFVFVFDLFCIIIIICADFQGVFKSLGY